MNLNDWTMTRTDEGHYQIRKGTLLYATVQQVRDGDEAGFRFVPHHMRSARPKKLQPTLAEAIKKSNHFEQRLIHHLIMTARGAPSQQELPQ